MRHMAVCQDLVPLVNIKIAGKWMFIPLKMVLIGIDPYPYILTVYLASILASLTYLAYVRGRAPLNRDPHLPGGEQTGQGDFKPRFC